MDLVDFLLKTIMEIVAWIFGAILKHIMAIIGGIFSFIVGLFKGDKSDE